MRTNIDIDDELMARAMQAGPFKTKREAVEAGLKLLARQAAYREILKWEGKLKWEGDESIDWTQGATESMPPRLEGENAPLSVQEPPPPPYVSADAVVTTPAAASSPSAPSAASAPAAGSKRRARR
jgi:Arc/MetJ family transcription regulator